MKRSATFLRMAWLAALLPLVACACPPARAAYDNPEATLASWQSQLCRDDVQGEWRCLSTGLQRAMGGFQTYLAARRQLLQDDPALAWLLGRADLAASMVSRQVDRRSRQATLTFDARGQRVQVRFVQETAARIDLDDGRFLFAVPGQPIAGLIGQQRVAGRLARQWIDLAEPALDADDIAHVETVLLAQRWKIDAITGLQPPRETP